MISDNQQAFAQLDIPVRVLEGLGGRGRESQDNACDVLGMSHGLVTSKRNATPRTSVRHQHEFSLREMWGKR